MKKLITAVLLAVTSMSMVVTSANAKSRSSSRSSFSSFKSSSYSFKSSSSYKSSSSSSSSHKPSTSYNKPSTVSTTASSYTVKPVVPFVTKPSIPTVTPTNSKVSTAVKAAGVGAVATAGAVATHNVLTSDHNITESTTHTVATPTESHNSDSTNVTSDKSTSTTIPNSTVKPVIVSLDKKEAASTSTSDNSTKSVVPVAETKSKPTDSSISVKNVSAGNKNVNRPQNRTTQNMMTYYALRNMHRPTRGYHTYGSTNYNNKVLSLSEWERTVNSTSIYTKSFDSVKTFEEKALKECNGQVYSCDNTNSDDFFYDVALYKGFVDALGARAKSYGVPDLQNRVYSKFQSDYQNNKYRLEKISSKMNGDQVTVSIIKQAYFTGYAAGLYTVKNHL